MNDTIRKKFNPKTSVVLTRKKKEKKSQAGKTVWISNEQKRLIWEAFDMLKLDYDGEHPETNKIEKLLKKLSWHNPDGK